jgi:hypothetical protein
MDVVRKLRLEHKALQFGLYLPLVFCILTLSMGQINGSLNQENSLDHPAGF